MRVATIPTSALGYFKLNQGLSGAIDTLSLFPGRRFEFDNLGYLDTTRVTSGLRLQDVRQRQEDVTRYIDGVFDLNPLLEELMRSQNRRYLNYGLVRFVDPSLKERCSEKIRFFSLLIKNDAFKSSKEARKFFAELLKDPELQDFCISQEQIEKIHEALEMTSDEPVIALLGMLCAHPSYFLSVLTSNKIGLKDENPTIRLATIKLFKMLAISTRLECRKERERIKSLDPNGDFIIYDPKDNIVTLDLVRRAIWQDGFGLSDENEHIQAKSVELDLLCKQISDEIKSATSQKVVPSICF